MIISEKQIGQLIVVAHGYISIMHQTGNDDNAGIAQELLAEINNQQSDELKEIT